MFNVIDLNLNVLESILRDVEALDDTKSIYCVEESSCGGIWMYKGHFETHYCDTCDNFNICFAEGNKEELIKQIKDLIIQAKYQDF